MAKNNESVSTVRRAKHGGLLTFFFAIVSIIWIAPLFLVLMNSLSDGWDSYVKGIERAMHGWKNYATAVKLTDFFHAFGYSLFITVASVIIIIICTSMCAWYITRVHNLATKTIYVLCLFSMIVPLGPGWPYLCLPGLSRGFP